MLNLKLYGIWIILFIVAVPMAFNLVPPNGLYGVRTAKTLANPDVWRRANVFSGWIMMVTALIGGAVIRFSPYVARNWSTPLVVALVLIDVVVSLIYAHAI